MPYGTCTCTWFTTLYTVVISCIVRGTQAVKFISLTNYKNFGLFNKIKDNLHIALIPPYLTHCIRHQVFCIFRHFTRSIFLNWKICFATKWMLTPSSLYKSLCHACVNLLHVWMCTFGGERCGNHRLSWNRNKCIAKGNQCTSVCPDPPNYILVVIYIESASTEFPWHNPGVVYTALLFAKLTNHKCHTWNLQNIANHTNNNL